MVYSRSKTFFRMKNEKNISTQQTSSQKDPWISQADEIGGRKESPQAPPSQRAQNVNSCVKFPKQFRLLTKRDFNALKGNSKRLVGKTLCIDYRISPKGVSRLGISASGKFGTSCERNRFKRLTREAFRIARLHLPPLDLHVVPRQYAKGATLADISAEFQKLC